MDINYKRLSLFSVSQMVMISKIITACGVDMYNKYGLEHWHNSLLKTILIVYYTIIFKHTNLWAVYCNEEIVGTFQTKREGDYLNFCKFAISPSSSGQGIGGRCIDIMVKIARTENLKALTCEVLDISKHALDFYIKRGFIKTGTIKTLKYTEIKLIKWL